MALSIASTGLSLGGVILTPLSVLMVESLTFTTAAPLMGVLYLVGVIPVALIWLRPSPAAMGLAIDGGHVSSISHNGDSTESLKSSTVKGVDVSLDGLSFKEARSGRFFWGVAFGYIFLMMAQVGGIAHQFGLARELLTESQTAIAIAILPVASIVGRLIGGWIVDQMSIRAFAVFMMVLQGLSLSLLSAGVNVVTLCLGLSLFGVTVGNLLMLQPLLIAEAFGVRDYARIFSVASLMSSWGTAVTATSNASGWSQRVVSPPTRGTSNSSASVNIPSKICSTVFLSSDFGRAMDTVRAIGRTAMAAQSLRLQAIAFLPTSDGSWRARSK